MLKHLRASARCRHAPVLIVSSSDAPRDRAAVETLGVAGYFKKPSELREFMKLGPLVKGLLASRQRPGRPHVSQGFAAAPSPFCRRVLRRSSPGHPRLRTSSLRSARF